MDSLLKVSEAVSKKTSAKQEHFDIVEVMDMGTMFPSYTKSRVQQAADTDNLYVANSQCFFPAAKCR
jgi:hypothetical protein